MMTEGIVMATIAAVASVAVACLNAYDRRERKRRQMERDSSDAEAARRAEQGERLQLLMMTQQVATGDGVKVLLHKAHGDHINGDCDAALKRIEKADAELGKYKDEIIISSG